MLQLPDGDSGANEPAEEADTAKDSTKSRDPVTQSDKAASNPKKRTLEEIKSGVTEEELESYKRSRLAADDPMASFAGKDEVLQ